ncbi:MAG TPA: SDR family oxidoreductase [Cyclobacteriaceae bacterium]|nr:SDR family oxidoreductase [Cyclobacteriaceae bacterium]
MILSGRVAIVTGASRGIGLAIVHALLAKGTRVAGWSRTKPNLNHPNFTHYTTDITDKASVEQSFKLTVRDFGDEVRVLINNAGLGYECELDALSTEQWHEMFDTNVNGIFYASRLVIPFMKKAQRGHIINISSVAGTQGIPGMAAYCATKYAVRGLSQSLFKELRPHGIKVTCIYPGSVKTNFFDKIDSVELNDDMMMPEEIASTVLHCLEAPDNYHVVDIEMRPLSMKKRM